MAVSTAVDLKYSYPFTSDLEVIDGKSRLRLATFGGIEQHPYFFQGKMLYPRKTADLLLTCSLVSRTRFYSPTEIRERLLAAADPVVTSGGDRLRFEAFSVCCGVYCRLDLNPGAIDGEWTGRGTTNVDFNPPMRAALSSVLDSEKVGLNVGADVVELERSSGKVVEKKVKMPVRWLKGFVEVQSYQTRMRPAFEVSAIELRHLLRSLPQHQVTNRGTLSYLVPSGKSLRLSQREAPKSVAVGAPGRLKMLEDVLRHAKTVRIYTGTDAVAALEVVMPEASFHVILSPDASRGFSGEGQALQHMTRQENHDHTALVRSTLQWQAKIDSSAIAENLSLATDQVDAVLALLGTRGLVGFDLAEGKYFHRELPFDLQLVEDLQPRMQKARRLAADKCVRISKKTSTAVEAYVKGDSGEHRVVIDERDARCTCPWYCKHPGERGPCSHILAVEIADGGE